MPIKSAINTIIKAKFFLLNLMSFFKFFLEKLVVKKLLKIC